MNISEFKQHFTTDSQFVHLNNAGQALVPDVYRDLAIKWQNRFFTEGAHCSMEGWHQVEQTRISLAKFIGADTDEVGFVQTTASALSHAAFSIPINSDDEVLTWDQEYPSNYYPWKEVCLQKNAKLIQVRSEQWETPLEKLLSQVNSKTKVIAVSWVQFQTGAVTDLLALSKALQERNVRKDIWLVADIIQGVGVRPFHFHQSGFDIVCFGTHKWMCSGYAGGIFVCRKEKLEQIHPLEFGAMTFGTPDTAKGPQVTSRKTASKLEPGSKPMIELISMGASIALLEKFGINNILKEATRISELMASELKSHGYEIHSKPGPILNFAPSDRSLVKSIAETLTQAKVSFALRGEGIRLSFHAYNSEKDIDAVLNALTKR